MKNLREVLRYYVEGALREQALQNSGVDNWNWYDETEFPTEDEVEEALDKLVERVKGCLDDKDIH